MTTRPDNEAHPEAAPEAEPADESPARADDDGGSSQPDTSATTSAASTDDGQLMARAAIMDYSARWEAIQQGFVDDPRSAVTDADTLVGDVLQHLSVTFDEQRGELERQWSDGEPSTEDLRSALQRYRDFFQRLLAI